MRRALSCIFVLIFVLTTAFIGGCSNNASASAGELITAFLDKLCAGEYSECYKYLDTDSARSQEDMEQIISSVTKSVWSRYNVIGENGRRIEYDTERVYFTVSPSLGITPTTDPSMGGIDVSPDAATTGANVSTANSVLLSNEPSSSEPGSAPSPTEVITPAPSPSPVPSTAPAAIEDKPLEDVLKEIESLLDNQQYLENTFENISEERFAALYESTFDMLDITSMSYSIESINEGQYITTLSYTLTYHSALAGDITHTFSLVMRNRNNGWAIPWSPSLIFPNMDWGDRIVKHRFISARGEIVAAKGYVMAENVSAHAILANTSEIAEPAAFSQQVASLLGLDASALEKRIRGATTGSSIMLDKLYPDELTDTLKEQLLLIDGISIDSEGYGYLRNYPFSDTLAHVLGYVGFIDEEKLDQYNEGRTSEDGLYNPDSIVGRSGLERLHEYDLRGRDGYMIFIRGYNGINQGTLYKKDVQDGYDVKTTFDMDLQLRLEEVLDLTLYGDDVAAAVVVMDPTTGAIQAMSSYPSYDVNQLARGNTAYYKELTNDAQKPLLNRITQGLYPPGSTFKAFTAAAALQYNVLTPDYVFTGKIVNDYWTPTEYGTWIWPSIKRAEIRNRELPLNMRNAMLHSDNIYFANAALLMGEDRFIQFLEKIGMNGSVPFELGSLNSQIVNENTDISYKLLADMGYGQGELLVTPLQLAAMFSAFANGGSMVAPRIVEGLYKTEGSRYSAVSIREPEIWIENAVTQSAVSNLLPMLEDVVNSKYNGTGRPLRVKNCTVAGKTGTAEIGSDKSREISWFVGFRTGVSDEDARLALVMIEIPNEDKYTSLKFSIARAMLEMETSPDESAGG